SRRRHTRFSRDWSSDVCSSDLIFMRSTAYLRSAGLVLGLGMAALLAGCLSGSGSSSGSGLLPEPSMPNIPEERVLPLIFVHGTRSEERRVGREGSAWRRRAQL